MPCFQFVDGPILIASVFFGGAVLFLLWFAAAIASTLLLFARGPSTARAPQRAGMPAP